MGWLSIGLDKEDIRIYNAGHCTRCNQGLQLPQRAFILCRCTQCVSYSFRICLSLYLLHLIEYLLQGLMPKRSFLYQCTPFCILSRKLPCLSPPILHFFTPYKAHAQCALGIHLMCTMLLLTSPFLKSSKLEYGKYQQLFPRHFAMTCQQKRYQHGAWNNLLDV